MKRFLCMVVALALLGCGRHHDTPDTPTPTPTPDTETDPPVLAVTFPAPFGVTDRAALTIRGTATDESDIVRLEVNGAAADTNDGFATWSAVMTLSLGENPIAVEAEDAFGNIATTDLAVTRQDAYLYYAGFPETPGNTDELFFYDTVTQSLVHADLANDLLDVVSSPHAGAGALPGNVVDARYDPTGRILLLDAATASVMAIDPTTGSRSVVSGNGTGGGPALQTPVALSAAGPIVVADNGLAALLTIDAANGTRVIVSDAMTGTGPTLAFVSAVTVDSGNNRAFVANFGGGVNALIEVDLATGDRTTLVDDNSGQGSIPQGALRYDPVGNRLLVASNNTVFEVDPTTGSFSELSANDGMYLTLSGITVASDGTLFTVDRDTLTVLQISPADGTRSVRLERKPQVGSGPSFSATRGLSSDGTRFALIAGAVYVIDPLSGERQAWSLGADPYNGSSALAPELGAMLLGVSDFFNPDPPSIHTMDLQSGDITVFTDPGVGFGPGLNKNQVFLEWDPPRHRALQGLDPLLAIDATTRDRTVVSSSTYGLGTGPDLSTLPAIDSTLDPDHDVMYVLTIDGEVYGINVANGDRRLVASASVGSGPDLPVGALVWVPGTPNLFLVGATTVLRIDPATGDRIEAGSFTQIDAPLVNATSAYVLPSGALYLSSDALTALDVPTGDWVVVSQ